jgi:hypothetical protein
MGDAVPRPGAVDRSAPALGPEASISGPINIRSGADVMFPSSDFTCRANRPQPVAPANQRFAARRKSKLLRSVKVCRRRWSERLAGRCGMLEQTHQHRLLRRRMRRLDAGGRQRERGHEEKQARAHHTKKGALHDVFHSCHLDPDLTAKGAFGFRDFVVCASSRTGPAPARGERWGRLGVYHLGD